MFGIKLILLRSESYVATFWIVRNLSSLVWDVFNNFLFIDATDRRKISSDQKRLFIVVSLYPLSFFANTPFNKGPNLMNWINDHWLKSKITNSKFNIHEDLSYWFRIWTSGMLFSDFSNSLNSGIGHCMYHENSSPT